MLNGTEPDGGGNLNGNDHCYSSGAASYLSATAMSHALKKPVSQFDCVQRSLIFTYVGLEQGAEQLYVSRIRAKLVKRSIRGVHRERRSF
jgi:hypothetical protein